jgi:hypothetical protein
MVGASRLLEMLFSRQEKASQKCELCQLPALSRFNQRKPWPYKNARLKGQIIAGSEWPFEVPTGKNVLIEWRAAQVLQDRS